jgi:DNA modification methylase
MGDLWICGRHRVQCGDATSAENVTRLLNGRSPALMVTDPPYGVDYDPMWREAAGLGKQRQTGAVANDDRVDWSEAYALFPGDVAYVWHAAFMRPKSRARCTPPDLRFGLKSSGPSSTSR